MLYKKFMLNPNFNRSVFVSLLSGIIWSSAVNFIIPFSLTTEVLAQTVNPRKAEADKLFAEGLKLYNSSQYSAALKSWEDALKIYTEIRDHAGESNSLGSIGNVYHSLGEHQKALDYFQQSLTIAKEIGDRSSISRTLNNIGFIYKSLGEHQKALDYFQQSLTIAKEIRDRYVIRQSSLNIADVYYHLGKYQKSLEYYQQSLSLNKEIGNRAGITGSLLGLGNVYHNLGEYQKSLEYYQQSLSLNKEIGDRSSISGSLGSIGNVYKSLGEYQKALEYYRQSLTIAKEIGDRSSITKSLLGIGNVYHNLGEYQKSLEYHQQSLSIQKEIGDRAGIRNSLHNIGDIYNHLGEYQKALDYYQQSLVITTEIGDRFSMSSYLNNIGLVYHNLGQYQKALEYHQQSLSIQKQIGDRAGLSKSLLNIGNVYNDLGEYEKALDYYQQSLTIKKEIGDRAGLTNSLIGIGNVYDSLGEYQKALDYYQQSLSMDKEIGDRAGVSKSLNNIGNVYESLGEYQKALEYYQQSLTIQKKIGDRAGEGISLGNIGIAYARLKNYVQSEKYLFAAIDILDSLRLRLKDQDKVSIFETQTSSYYNLQSVLVAQNKTEQALEVSERSRARAFMELLSSRLGNTSIKPPTLAQIKDIAKKENATLVEYSIVEDKLLIWVIEPTAKITLRQVDLKSKNLAEIAEKGRVAAAIGRARSSEAENTKISELVRGTRETLSKSVPSSQPTIRNLQQLYQLLIQPIDDLLPTNPDAHVIFIPHQSLFLVPFPALQDAQGTYLIQKHTILTATSIQQLEFSHQQLTKNQQTNPPNSLVVGIPRNAVILGNPSPMPKVIYRDGTSEQLKSLKGAEDEAKAIAKILKIEPLIGNQATKKIILQQMSEAKIIHLATHGLLADLGTGIPGVLAFAPSGNDNGLLTSSEIFDLKLNASLVILSACNTGRGKLTGDGVIGLSRAFLSAGVPSIIVSLWAVNDASTAFLMTQFYRHWQEGKMDKAQALRQAMLNTMKQYPKPGNWAAFTLIGETQ
jgi:tetratricopeptide (TPR) repeat protein